MELEDAPVVLDVVGRDEDHDDAVALSDLVLDDLAFVCVQREKTRRFSLFLLPVVVSVVLSLK